MEAQRLLPLIIVFFFAVSTPAILKAQKYSYDSRPEMEDGRNKVDSLTEDAWNSILDGKRDTAKLIAQFGLDLAIKIEYKLGKADALSRLGTITQLYERSRLSYADSCFYEAYKLRIEEKKNLLAVRSINSLVNTNVLKNDFYRAVEFAELGLDTLEKVKPKNKEYYEIKSKLQNSLGAAYRNISQPFLGIPHLVQSLTIREQYGKKKDIMKTLLNLGNLYNDPEVGDYVKAKEYYKRGLVIAQEINDKGSETGLLIGLGNTCMFLDQLDSARVYYEQILQSDYKKAKIDKIRAEFNLGEILNREGRIQEAIAQWEHCEVELNEQPHPRLATRNKIALGRTYLSQGEVEKGVIYLEKARSSARSIGNASLIIAASKPLSEYYAQTKDYEKAYSLTQEYADLDSLGGTQGQQVLIYRANLEEERKEKAEVETNKAREQRNYSLVGLGLIAIILMALIWSYLNFRNSQKLKGKLQTEKIKSLESEQDNIINIARAEGQNKERERLGDNLHDDLGGDIAAVIIYLTSMKSIIEGKVTQIIEPYNKMLKLLDDSYKKLRRISKDLKDENLEYGLEILVNQIKEKISGVQQIKINVEVVGEKQVLNSDIKINIFRIIQEAVTNALKYSKGEKINITLSYLKEELEVLIEDNGVGFDMKKIIHDKTKGIGLSQMQNRAKQIEGRLEIKPEPGNGTIVSLSVPIKKIV